MYNGFHEIIANIEAYQPSKRIRLRNTTVCNKKQSKADDISVLIVREQDEVAENWNIFGGAFFSG